MRVNIWGVSLLALSVGILGQTAKAQQAASSSGTAAQPATQIEEITVTASKRAGTVQDTPISVSAYSGQDIQDRGITDFNNLAAATPGVSLKDGGPGQTEFEIRGLTSSGGNSPTVGFYLDDTSLTAPAAAQNGKVVIDPNLYDLNRVEVLRGPQGTLYGSGSMGGTIKVITNQPDPSAFDATAQTIDSGTVGGGFNHAENAMVNIPFADGTAALRIVGSEAYTSGWIDRTVIAQPFWPLNPNGSGEPVRGLLPSAPVAANYSDVNDAELLGTRMSILWKPNDRLTITPSLFYQRTTQGGESTFDSDPGTLTHYEAFDIPEPYSDRFIDFSLNIVYKFDDFDVSSTTSKWNRTSNIVQDTSDIDVWGLCPFVAGCSGIYRPGGLGTSTYDEADYSKQTSEEVKITSSGDTRFKWLVGSYYSSFESDFDIVNYVPGLVPFIGDSDVFSSVQPTDIVQTAAFGEMSYKITDQLKLTTGLRWYSYQESVKSTVGGYFQPFPTTPTGLPPSVTTGSEADEGFNPKFDLSYDVDKDVMIYTSAAKGFRPGGTNQPLNPLAGCPVGVPLNFGADSIWSYELGEKARLADNRVTVNSDVYYENWTGVQQSFEPACGYGFTENAGTAHVYGSEVEVHAIIVPGLVATTSAGYTHAFVTQNVPYPGAPGQLGFFSGERLQDVPTWTGSVQLAYTTDITDSMSLTAHLETNYVGTERSGNSASASSIDGQLDVPAYLLTNLRVGVEQDKWSASLFANNLFDKHAWVAYNNSLSADSLTYNRVTSNQPLTIGVDLSYHY